MNTILKAVKPFIAITLVLALIACNSDDNDNAPASSDFDGRWVSSCVYNEGKKAGYVHWYEFANDRFSLTKEGYSDSDCSQITNKGELSGTVTYGNMLTTTSGMKAHETNFLFENGETMNTLIARQGDTLYLATASEGGALPTDLDQGAFELTIDSTETSDTEAGNIPEGIQDVWFVGSKDIDYDPISNTMDYKLSSLIIVTFSDGSVTRNPDAIFTDGVAESMQKYPKSWGQWQENNGILEIKWANAKKFSEAGDFSLRSLHGQEDERLDACFSTASYSSSPTGVSASASNIWCFKPNGQFTNDRSGMVNSSTDSNPDPEVSIYDSADKSGQYRIDGHVAQFTYNNGKIFTTTFGLLESLDEGKSPSLLLGSTEFKP